MLVPVQNREYETSLLSERRSEGKLKSEIDIHVYVHSGDTLEYVYKYSKFAPFQVVA